MAVYVDFAFSLGGTRLVAAGWGLRDALAVPFTVRDGPDPVRAGSRPDLFTHVRADVADGRAVGFVMVFPGEDGPLDDREATFTFESEAFSTAARYTGQALDDFVGFAGDEPFYTLVREIGAGRLPPLRPREAALVFDRIRARPEVTIQTPRLAAALDVALADDDAGTGLALGWVLAAASGAPVEATLLAAGPAGIALADAAFDALPRPDLAGFRSRYRIDGRCPGFIATFPVAPPGERSLLVLVLTAGEDVAVVSRAPEPADFLALARRYLEVAHALDAGSRSRVRGGLTRPLAALRLDPAPASAGPAPASAGPAPASAGAAPLLLLEHDGRPRDLREVLGRIAGLGLRRFDLALPGRVLDEDFANAFEGARRDTPDLLPRLLPGDGLATGLAAEDGPVVYVRSSALIQSDVLPWLLEVGAAGLLGRIALAPPGRVRLAGGPPAALAADIARKGLPFAVALGGGAPMRRLLAGGRGLLTVAGRMLWAFGRIPDGAAESRLLPEGLLVGDAAAGTELLPGGHTPRAFDLETIASYT